MASWPLGLQQLLLASEFSLTTEDTVIRTDSDYGPAKTRKRYTDAVEKMTCSIHIDMSQYQILYDFYKTTLSGGALAFDFIHPITQEAVRCRFTQPPTYTPLGGRVFNVSMNWEILP